MCLNTSVESSRETRGHLKPLRIWFERKRAKPTGPACCFESAQLQTALEGRRAFVATARKEAASLLVVSVEGAWFCHNNACQATCSRQGIASDGGKIRLRLWPFDVALLLGITPMYTGRIISPSLLDKTRAPRRGSEACVSVLLLAAC